MSLCGLYLKDKIHVRGYTELVLEPNGNREAGAPPQMMDPRQVTANMTVIVQHEEWILTPTDPNLSTGRIWKGTYSLKQLPRVAKTDNNPDNAPVLMDFELEVYEKGATLPSDSSKPKDALTDATEKTNDPPAE